MSFNPKLSIICLAYNHETYIKYVIESALQQTSRDFELIIVDDCSSDNTYKTAKQYENEQIKVITKDFNKGINDSINLALEYVNGQYVAFIGSDDMFEPDYVESVLKAFEEHPNVGLVYTPLKIMDENNNLVLKDGKESILPLPKNKNRYEILNELFFKENCLYSPGMAVKTDLIKRFMPYDISMINTQDYQMHIMFLLSADCYMLEKPVIKYRRSLNHASVSAVSETALDRYMAETPKIMEVFLRIDNLETLKNIFPEYKNGYKYQELISYYLGKTALKSKDKTRQLWGYHVIMQFMSEKGNMELLHKLENFNFADYLSLAKCFNNKDNKRMKKYKKLFNIFLIVSIVLLILLIALMMINLI